VKVEQMNIKFEDTEFSKSLLEEIPLLNYLDEKERVFLNSKSKVKYYQPGDLLLEMNDYVSHIYLIVKGRVEETRKNEDTLYHTVGQILTFSNII
jgi:signal-transduction protein with cAMP-binding, CBS, and nucleotidyltransferase domain